MAPMHLGLTRWPALVQVLVCLLGIRRKVTKNCNLWQSIELLIQGTGAKNEVKGYSLNTMLSMLLCMVIDANKKSERLTFPCLILILTWNNVTVSASKEGREGARDNFFKKNDSMAILYMSVFLKNYRL